VVEATLPLREDCAVASEATNNPLSKTNSTTRVLNPKANVFFMLMKLIMSETIK
jgi:hypothetical protein